MDKFASLTIPRTDRYWIIRAAVPTCFLAAPLAAPSRDEDGTVALDLLIAEGRIAKIVPTGTVAIDAPSVALEGRQLWPALIDMHAHLDKGHVVARTPNRAGSFADARQASSDDRTRYWSAEDLRARIAFGLRCAYAHGVAAIRTHLDSHEGQAEVSWAVFREMRARWADRVTLQAAALVPFDVFRTDYGVRLADLVAESGGVLGGVTRASGGVHSTLLEDVDTLLDTIFRLAAERGLAVDLHVDESGDTAAAALPRIAAAVLRNRFQGRVVCGHCCSLALQPEETIRRTIALCAEAGIAVVTLPTVNMYLQDRTPGRTPRWRGVTPIQELRRAGIAVAVAGDNCRDPFYAYGDHDMLDTWRAAVRIAHLDHPFADSPALAGPVPAAIIGVAPLGTLAAGAPARLILLNARTLNEVMCRPQSDRIVLDAGRVVTEALPDYAELDALVTPAARQQDDER